MLMHYIAYLFYHSADVQFPGDWHTTRSENHWSNASTMQEYVENVMVPYAEAKRWGTGKHNQEALGLFHIFAAHRQQTLKD